jgi:hypothetical protein
VRWRFLEFFYPSSFAYPASFPNISHRFDRNRSDKNSQPEKAMDTTKPPIFSGDLREIYDRELNEIREGGLLKQLWSGDVTLWPPPQAGSEHFRTNLEFRHLPDKLPEIAEAVLRAETLARAEGLTDRVLIAFENSHHLCEALLNICTPPTPLNWMIMHSSHPSVIRRIESQIELKKLSSFW